MGSRNKGAEQEIFRQLRHHGDDISYLRRLIENHLNDTNNPHRTTDDQTRTSSLPSKSFRRKMWIRLFLISWVLLVVAAFSVVAFVFIGYLIGGGPIDVFWEMLWQYSTVPAHSAEFLSMTFRAFVVFGGLFSVLMLFSRRVQNWVIPNYHG